MCTLFNRPLEELEDAKREWFVGREGGRDHWETLVPRHQEEIAGPSLAIRYFQTRKNTSLQGRGRERERGAEKRVNLVFISSRGKTGQR